MRRLFERLAVVSSAPTLRRAGLTSDQGGSFRVPGQVERVGCLIVIHPRRHVDDDGLRRADVFLPMIEIGRDNEQPRILLAQGELVYASRSRRVPTIIEYDDLDEPAYHEQAVRAF